jgi:Domain of unknown function (DUF4124)
MRTTSVTLLPLLFLGLACAAAADTIVYKWVDETGVTHYSDQPHPAAQTLELRSAQTYSSPDASASTRSDAGGPAQAAAAPYSLCELYRPENDEVFLNTDTVTAKLRLQPQLLPGDRIVIGLDGKRQTSQPSSGSDFVLTQVERGTHTVIAVVEDSAGKEICRSSPITFHVRQPSRQAPNPANRPRF